MKRTLLLLCVTMSSILLLWELSVTYSLGTDFNCEQNEQISARNEVKPIFNILFSLQHLLNMVLHYLFPL